MISYLSTTPTTIRANGPNALTGSSLRNAWFHWVLTGLRVKHTLGPPYPFAVLVVVVLVIALFRRPGLRIKPHQTASTRTIEIAQNSEAPRLDEQEINWQ